MIEDGLYNALKGHLGVAAKTLVPLSSPARYNIFPLRFPEGLVLTGNYAITYTEIRNEVNYQFSKTATFQITAFATSFDKARQLAADIDDALNDTKGTLLGGTFPVVYVQLRNRQSLFDETSGLWYFALDYSIKF